MQTLIFVRRTHGVSAKGRAYDMTEVSNGISSFILTNDVGVGQELEEKYTEGDKFDAEVHVSTNFGALRGTIVAIN